MKTNWLLLLLFISPFTYSQDLSNKGKDFWVGYAYHVRYVTGNPINGQEMVLYFATEEAANVKVEIPAVGYVKTYTIPANTIFDSDPLPKTGSQDARLTGEGLFNTGIHISSDKPIVAYAHIYNQNVSGATLLFPTTTLGKEYYSLNYTQKSNEGSSNSFVFVVAADTGTTTVEITPAATTLNHPANVPFTVDLTQGQIYNVMGALGGCVNTGNGQECTGVDLTGSRVRSISSGTNSCKRIAVFAGSGKVFINCGSSEAASSDNFIAQVFPKTAWGQRFLTAPTRNMPYNYFRVAVSDPATVVKVNGAVISGLVNNFFYDLPLTRLPLLIETDKPAMVAQYITTSGSRGSGTCGNQDADPQNGDPEMIYLSPIEQTTNKVILNSTSHFAITEHFINLIIKTNDVSSVRLDGSPVTAFSPHPADPTYSYTQVSVAAGHHTVTADSGFNVIAYGYGQAESYGYNGGTNLKDLYQFISIINPFSIVDFPTACAGTPFYFAITLPYQPLSLTWEFHGFQSPDTTVNNPVSDTTYFIKGRQVWRYRLQKLYGYNIGVYPVTVLAYNPTPEGCNGEQLIDFDLNVYDPPVAKFTYTHTLCGAPDVARFTDNSTLNGRPVYKHYWNFGDGKIDSVANPTHTFISPGTYHVKHTVLTDVGCLSDTAFDDIIVTPLPLASYNYNSPSCAGKKITFTSNSVANAGALVQWKWDFNDGSPIDSVTGPVVTHTFTASGTYAVSLTVTTDRGCLDDTLGSVTINAQPVANFIPPKVCLSDPSAKFQDSSYISDGTASQFSYLWGFGDPSSGASNTSTLASPSHKYISIGPYTAKLIVTSVHGCVDSISKSFTVNGTIPKADFDVLHSDSLCSNTLVSIMSTSSVDFYNLTRVEVYWDNANSAAFDADDNPATNKVYTHLYLTSQSLQTFLVRLRAFSGATCVNEIIKTISVNPTPKVQFNAIPDQCYYIAPDQLTQGSDLSGATGTGVYSGRGVSATGLFNPKVAGVGVDTIRFTFTSNKGCVDYKDQTVKVLEPPVAKFSFDAPQCDGQPVTFRDESSSAVGSIVTWTWDFGDGTPVVNKTDGTPFTHTFPGVAKFIVKLTVVTSDQCYSAVFQDSVRTHYKPVVSFSGTKEVCLPDAKIQFTDLSTIPDGTEAGFTYLWDFADPASPDNSSILKDPTHIYEIMGPLPVKLTVTSVNGCFADYTMNYNGIRPQPVASFTFPSEDCINRPVQFTDASTGVDTTIRSWYWDFNDDGHFSTLQNPTYAFDDPEDFRITLTVTNDRGCVGSTTSTIVIDPYPDVLIDKEQFVLEGGTTVLDPVTHGVGLTYLWTPNKYLSDDQARNPTASGVEDITYTLTVTGIGAGCATSKDVFVKVLKPLVIPNAFSPNGDGINDVWNIQYLEFYKKARLQVFNRYGQAVYETRGFYQPWDGTLKGKLLPVGTYYYVIEPGNGQKPFTGSVTLVY